MSFPLRAGERSVARGFPPEGSNLSVEELGLSTRTRNCLRRARIRTVDELAQRTPGDLLRIPGFGAGCLAEVVRVLGERGLSLGNHPVGRSAWAIPPGPAPPGDASGPGPEPVVIEDPVLERAFDRLLAWAKVPPARRPALAARLAWPDGRRRTLQEAGDMAGVTRERVRQVQKRFEERVRRQVRVPVLERGLTIIRGSVPTTAEEASELLVDRGLAEGSVHPAALARLAEVLGVDPGFEVVGLGPVGDVVVAAGRAERARALHRAKAELKRAARPFGFIHADLARTRFADTLGDDAEIVELVMQVAGAILLEAGWFYLKTDSREPAVRLIEDMLAVAGGMLSAEEIAEGFERRLRWRGAAGHHDQEGWYPSPEALLAFCRSRPELFRVDGRMISSTRPLDPARRLVGVERIMVEALLDAPGRVLRRDDFEREVVARGVNRNTFSVYTSYSPFIRDLGGGLWSVRGVEPDPIEIERLRRRRPARRRRIQGWQWLPTGALRVQVRLARVTNLVVGLPGAVRSYLAGRTFGVVLPDGTTKGKVRVDEGGTSWGYVPALGELGAVEGDLLFADFDLAAGSVRLSLARTDDERAAADA